MDAQDIRIENKEGEDAIQDAASRVIAVDEALAIGGHHQSSYLHEVQERFPQRMVAHRDPHQKHHIDQTETQGKKDQPPAPREPALPLGNTFAGSPGLAVLPNTLATQDACPVSCERLIPWEESLHLAIAQRTHQTSYLCGCTERPTPIPGQGEHLSASQRTVGVVRTIETRDVCQDVTSEGAGLQRVLTRWAGTALQGDRVDDDEPPRSDLGFKGWRGVVDERIAHIGQLRLLSIRESYVPPSGTAKKGCVPPSVTENDEELNTRGPPANENTPPMVA